MQAHARRVVALEVDVALLDHQQRVLPFAVVEDVPAARGQGDHPHLEVAREVMVQKRQALAFPGHHNAGGRSNAFTNGSRAKVVTSTILPSSMRRTSSASGRYSASPGRRR